MICKPCCDRDHENWQTIPPTDRNTFVSVWTLDDDSISGRQFTQEAS
jgi:hypothetical protein